MSEKKDNVIPFRSEKKSSPEDRLKASLDSINRKMTELREMATKQTDYLSDAGHVPPSESISTLDQEELEKEYRRKQDEMRKKREENNRSVTRSYQLTRRPDKSDK